MKTSFWKLISDNHIEIPVIQRDYAQGRIEEKEIANAFILKIKNKLITRNNLNLDFVYGKEVNNRITPLDGQQRLTTLFLLHWYLAMKEDQYTSDVKQSLHQFSYETRISSRDFCRNLVEKSIIQIDLEKPVSKQIENESWFFLSWKNDPTISAMLHMLDLIHEHFKDEEDKLFQYLVEENPLITFNYLPLDKFKLTDELYIKMNSRGKPLTDFENFKSQFSSLLDFNQKSRIDNEWYDIFWHFESEKEEPDTENVDRYFFNFFENAALCFYLESHDLIKIRYDAFNLFDDFKKIFYKNSPYLSQIVRGLDSLASYGQTSASLRTGITQFKLTSYPQKLRYYALIIFLIKKGEITKYPKEYNHWVRICSNLINNTLIQSVDDFIKAIRAIKSLSAGIDDIYFYLVSGNQVSGFLEAQQKEEAVKAELIINEPAMWEETIHFIENNPYFNGQIGFILELSKMPSGEYSIHSFREYSSKLDFLFRTLKDNEEFIFQRALFAIGDYRIKIGNAYTFCTFDTNLRSKMDNWRKVFSDRIDILKILLDHFSPDSYEHDLKNMIKNNNYSDWRRYFVDESLLLNGADNYQIKTEAGVFLARSTASGWQKKAEMYTYLLHKKFLSKTIYPFTGSWYFDTAYETPCACIDEWKINTSNFALDIFFTNGFDLCFFDRYHKDIPEFILEILNKYNFIRINEKFILKTGITTIEDAYEFIVEFCKNFN